ncbi:MAG TPA: hypothetical protein VH062_16795 [Polyangiaceae bacterium]|jgi:hypothetical protein|nr:hypothetical protein [Polyangiaceae bacterium]
MHAVEVVSGVAPVLFSVVALIRQGTIPRRLIPVSIRVRSPSRSRNVPRMIWMPRGAELTVGSRWG